MKGYCSTLSITTDSFFIVLKFHSNELETLVEKIRKENIAKLTFHWYVTGVQKDAQTTSQPSSIDVTHGK